jgi:hypothetical protein
MNLVYIQSTTIHILPTLYFRTNPMTIGVGWLGRSVEFLPRVELTISYAGVEKTERGATLESGKKPNPKDYRLPEDYYTAFLAYEDSQGMSEIEKEEREQAANTQEWINRCFIMKAKEGLNVI